MNPESVAIGIVVFLVAFLVIVFIVVIAVSLENDKKQRVAELSALADKLNLTFLEDGIPYEDPNGFFSLFGSSEPNQSSIYSGDFVSAFPLFNEGTARTISPALVGLDQLGNNWYIFEYCYTVRSGKSTITHQFTVAIVQSQIEFPEMALQPEHVGHSIGKFLGMQELQVESEEFNKRYYIKTSDERRSLDLLHPVAIEVLLRQPDYEWHMNGQFAMIHVTGPAGADQIEQMKNCIDEFLSQIPTYYRQDYSQAHE